MKPRDVQLEEVVSGVEKMLGRLIGEHVRVRMQCAAERNVVRIDPSQIEQIVLNLAVNARDAMPDGGDITIITGAVEYTEADARSRGLAAAGRYARLEVGDTGMGMDAQTRARIFEAFFTTKERERGTGPGARDRTRHRQPVRRRHHRRQRARSRDHLPHRPADRHARHMLLTDVVLPSMTGRALAAEITSKRPGVRVLFMSGYTDDAAHGSALGGPALAKPFTAEVLARALRAALEPT